MARHAKKSPVTSEGENVGQQQYEDIFYFSANELEPWPGLNPRKDFPADKFEQLCESVRQKGILQPLLVHDTEKDPRWIVAGETRWRAAKAVGCLIPAIVRKFTETEALSVALLENMHRNDLTEMEEARGFKRLLDLDSKLTQAKLGAQIGKSQPYIANRVRLLELPDPILKLMDEGIIDVSIARDVLLPFVKIPEKKRESFFRELAKRLRNEHASTQKNTYSQWNEETVRRATGEFAKARSHSLEQNTYDPKAPLFDPKLHDKCPCGGLSFKYDWNKTVRCFDDEWWSEQQNKARAQKEERDKKAIAKASEKAKQVAGKPVLSEKLFHGKFGHQDYQTLMQRGAITSGALLDPAQLPAESLVLVEDGKGYELVCTDMAAVKKARAVVEKEKKALVAERTVLRTAADVNEAKQSKIESWMLRVLMSSRPEGAVLTQVTRELGFAPALKRDESSFVGHGAAYKAVESLNDDDSDLLFKVLAIRARRGDFKFYNVDPVEAEVVSELTARYAPQYRALLPKIERGLSAENDAEIERRIAEIAAELKDREEYGDDSVENWQAFDQLVTTFDEFAASINYAPVAQDQEVLAAAREDLAESKQMLTEEGEFAEEEEVEGAEDLELAGV